MEELATKEIQAFYGLGDADLGLGADGNGMQTAQNITQMTVDLMNATSNLIQSTKGGGNNSGGNDDTNRAGDSSTTFTPSTRTTTIGHQTEQKSTPDWLPWAIGGGLLLILGGMFIISNNNNNNGRRK